MQTSDRFRIFRSLGLAVAALLLVGGAVFGSNALIGHTSDDNQPSASANLNGDHGQDGDESPDASESPEATADETAGEDLNEENADESPEASESEAPDASESPDSGSAGGEDANAE